MVLINTMVLPTNRKNTLGVFGLTFVFGFCSLKVKPNGWIQKATLSKNRLFRSAKLKTPLNLLLAAFR
jgi:hypothetical protein